jgi:hypothetical protein
VKWVGSLVYEHGTLFSIPLETWVWSTYVLKAGISLREPLVPFCKDSSE